MRFVKIDPAFCHFCTTPTEGTKSNIFKWSVSSDEALIELVMQEVRLVVLESYEVENRDMYLFIAFLTFSASQDSDSKKNSDDFSLEKSSSIKRFWVETMMKELNHVVMKKTEFPPSTD